MGVTFEVDHIIPASAGGKSRLSNLCLCCPTCNRHKSSRIHVPDTLTGAAVPLFHPVRERWDEHFAWRDDASLILGQTPTGRATIDALQMNRPQIVELRRYWAATGRHPEKVAKNR